MTDNIEQYDLERQIPARIKAKRALGLLVIISALGLSHCLIDEENRYPFPGQQQPESKENLVITP